MDDLIRDYLKKNKGKNDIIREETLNDFVSLHEDIILFYKHLKRDELNRNKYNKILAVTISGIALQSTDSIDEAILVLNQAKDNIVSIEKNSME